MAPTRSQSNPVAAGETPAEILGYRFSDPSLLQWAVTHRSFTAELVSGKGAPADPREDNEQLEFLGDAVLGLAVAELLVTRFPDSREGELTRMRASLVSRRHLATVAARIGVGPFLRLGRGEEQTGGRSKPALLANTLEAVLGAVYLDSRDRHGIRVVRDLIAREIVDPAASSLERAAAGQEILGDHKSALQEHLQATNQGQPRYILTEQSGPDHRKLFHVEVRSGEADGESRLLGSAAASSKKEAQQLAAQSALQRLLRTDPAPSAADRVDEVA